MEIVFNYLLFKPIDKLVNLDRLKMTKVVKYFEANIWWFIEYTNNSYMLEYNWIVAHLAVGWVFPFCIPIPSLDLTVSPQATQASTVVGLGLLVCLLFKPSPA